MAQYTYNDFKERISIQDVLVDAGYRLNRKDGMRYPSYVRVGSDGCRVKGDKFIVTANGMCCFQPPERKNYNVISFIKSFPELFAEYRPGMSTDRLVNLVCNRLLNNPVDIVEHHESGRRGYTPKPFNIDDYDIQYFDVDDWESQKPFCSYFKNRGISLDTQRAFCGHFFLATKHRDDGLKYTNLCFPLTTPDWPGKYIVGMEERSRPNAEGKTAYKGMAAGSNAAEGMWLGRLSSHRSDKGFQGFSGEVYWFESALDAMAFYQIKKATVPLMYHDLGNSFFVSTGGNPSNKQFRSMMQAYPDAIHHICFDNDRAGQMFAINLALNHEGRVFTSNQSANKDKLLVIDYTNGQTQHEIDLANFDFRKACAELGIDDSKLGYHLPERGYKDWNDQLMDKPMDEEARRTSGFKR